MQETILVPARTISDFYVRIKNSEQKQGFIPQLHLCNGVYLGNAVFSNNNNKAYMKIFNTNTQAQKLPYQLLNWSILKKYQYMKKSKLTQKLI